MRHICLMEKLLQRKLDPVELWAPAVKTSGKTGHSVSEKPLTEKRRVTVRLTYKGSCFVHFSLQMMKHNVDAYRAKLSMCKYVSRPSDCTPVSLGQDDNDSRLIPLLCTKTMHNAYLTSVSCFSECLRSLLSDYGVSSLNKK